MKQKRSKLLIIVLFIMMLWLCHANGSKAVTLGSILSHDDSLELSLSELKSLSFLTKPLAFAENNTVLSSTTSQLWYTNHDIYQGGLKGKVRHGNGTYTWNNGGQFTGVWDNDKATGDGTLILSDDILLNGSFKNNKLIRGTLHYNIPENHSTDPYSISDLSLELTPAEITVSFETVGHLRYQGSLSGLFDYGYGEVTYLSGNTYTGSFSVGKRSGTGTFTWYNKQQIQASYHGSWSNDMMNGYGRYYFNGSGYPYLEGTFKSNATDGSMLLHISQTESYYTIWENGKITKYWRGE